MPLLRDEINLDEKSEAELESTLNELVTKWRRVEAEAHLHPDDPEAGRLPDEDLHLLAAVTQQLRRRKSGPPKEPKLPKEPRTKSKVKLTLGDL